jgi:hypothetical protein
MNTLSDGRHRGWYHIDNAVLDEYGPLVGAIGMAVYNVLARRARETAHGRVAFPSYGTVAAAVNISRPTAIAAVRTLIAYGLISAETVREDGKRPVNHYTLMPVAAATGKGDLPVKEIYQSTGKADEPVNVANQSTGKGDLPVKEVSPTGKAALPEMVNDVDPNKTVKQDELNKTEKEGSARARASPRPRKSKLPDPFTVTTEMWQWAFSEGMDKQFVVDRTKVFVAHFRSSSTRLDSVTAWEARWMQWLLQDWQQRRRA